MPPDSPLFEEADNVDESEPLTDENIAILYQIIKSAEQQPQVDTLPFRAIFVAYEKILGENGLDPDHDQIYLRFLFRLGDSREEGQSLYERFEALLEELGFQIEFVAEEDGLQGTAKLADAITDGANAGETWRHLRRSRRTSFTSLYDAGDEGTRRLESRPHSRASMSRLENTERSVLDPRPSTRATTRKTEKTPVYASPSKLPRAKDKRDRLTARNYVNNSHKSEKVTLSTVNQPDRRDQNLVTHEAPKNQFPSPEDSAIEDPFNVTFNRHNQEVGSSTSSQPVESKYNINRHEQFYNPSRIQLVRDAETFYHYRIRFVAQDIVDRWCYAALQAKDRNDHLHRLAAARDTEILLRQALAHWRIRLHARKQALATERYFRQKEQSAIRARDLTLLAKAFTHWSQCASDERLRTINAQRKLLSMKYFRAWRDITVSNQLDVRHQGLRRFFGIWKKCYARNLREGSKAQLLHRENICRNAYWRWFWAFCERRAPEWRVGRLRRKYFLQWIGHVEDSNRRDQYVNLHHITVSQQKVLNKWLDKTRTIVSTRHIGTQFNLHHETSLALQSWRRALVFAPRYQQISNIVDWRVAGATFAVFVTRYRYERQAEMVNQMRIMRNGFTQWNDRLRWQTIARRIDDRFCLEALYRWVIFERRILLQRLSDERIKQRFLKNLRDEAAERKLQRTQSLFNFETAQRRNLVQRYLNCLHSRLVSHQLNGHIAFQFHAPKLAQDALQPWKRKLKEQLSANELAKDTYFYFIARRLLKCWHAAYLETRKRKRRIAYTQIRRKQKMELVRKILQVWRNASARTRDLELQARHTNQNRSLRFGASLFDFWHAQAQRLSDQDYQATQHYEQRLIERHAYTWIDLFENQSRREELAEVTFNMRIQSAALGCCNRLRLKIIELRGQEANAENLRNWYGKRHYRSMLRKWQEATMKKVKPQRQTGASSQPTRTGSRAIVDKGPTSQAEDWTEFDVGDWIPALEAQASSTPVPGYLSTPSKRAARAKALIKGSTTPVGTPFEQRLRSQLGSTPRSTRRGNLGRSVGALRNSTFGAILEDSPRTPGTREEG